MDRRTVRILRALRFCKHRKKAGHVSTSDTFMHQHSAGPNRRRRESAPSLSRAIYSKMAFQNNKQRFTINGKHTKYTDPICKTHKGCNFSMQSISSKWVNQFDSSIVVCIFVCAIVRIHLLWKAEDEAVAEV